MESTQKPAYRLEIRGSEVTRRRLELTMTRPELAKKAGISLNRLNKIEAGLAGGVSPTTAKGIARALRCEPSDIQVVEEVA